MKIILDVIISLMACNREDLKKKKIECFHRELINTGIKNPDVIFKHKKISLGN